MNGTLAPAPARLSSCGSQSEGSRVSSTQELKMCQGFYSWLLVLSPKPGSSVAKKNFLSLSSQLSVAVTHLQTQGSRAVCCLAEAGVHGAGVKKPVLQRATGGLCRNQQPGQKCMSNYSPWTRPSALPGDCDIWKTKTKSMASLGLS